MITARTLDVPGWVDLATDDPTAAIDFYAALLGWEVETSHTPMGEYHIGTVDGMHVGGVMAMPPGEEAPPAWTMFVNVADVADTLRRVTSAGGSVLDGPIPIPNGEVGVVADPTGAMFGVISYVDPPPELAWRSAHRGGVGWLDLLTWDPSVAQPFYTEVFGWEPHWEDGAMTTFTLGGAPVCGMLPMPDDVPDGVPSQWSVHFVVDDCEAAQARAVELGGAVVSSGVEDGIGVIAILADPRGATFEVMEVAP